jgi:hypothetical protein
MRLAIAADERTGVADALADRGHAVGAAHLVAMEAGR